MRLSSSPRRRRLVSTSKIPSEFFQSLPQVRQMLDKIGLGHDVLLCAASRERAVASGTRRDGSANNEI
jgi:hypothetical protein